MHGLITRACSFGETLNEIEVMDWFVQCVLALQHLHSQYVHVYVHYTIVDGFIQCTCARMRIFMYTCPICSYRILCNEYSEYIHVHVSRPAFNLSVCVSTQ